MDLSSLSEGPVTSYLQKAELISQRSETLKELTYPPQDHKIAKVGLLPQVVTWIHFLTMELLRERTYGF